MRSCSRMWSKALTVAPILVAMVAILNAGVEAKRLTHNIAPFLDASDGISDPPLHLTNSFWASLGSDGTVITTRVIRRYEENWWAYAKRQGDSSRSVTFRRWHFANTKDPAHYITAAYSDRVFGEAVFPGWNGAVIGERSFLREFSVAATKWYTATLIFTSGQDLIRVDLTGTGIDHSYLLARTTQYLQRVQTFEQSGGEDNDEKDDQDDQGDNNRDTPRHP